jgi:hypothetical protein
MNKAIGSQISAELGYHDGKLGLPMIGVSVSYVNGYRSGTDARIAIVNGVRRARNSGTGYSKVNHV